MKYFLVRGWNGKKGPNLEYECNFLLNSVHWILSSILSVSTIFLTFSNLLKSSTFCRPYFGGQNWTLFIKETFFSSKPSHVIYYFQGIFFVEQVLLNDHSIEIITEGNKKLWISVLTFILGRRPFCNYVLY